MKEGDEAAEMGGGGLAPWIRPDIQQNISWRSGDIVVSVPPKSGTTWTMNIVYQLLNGGTADFRDIYEEVPWIEFLPGPDAGIDTVLERIDRMPTERPRVFKSHSAPPMLPYGEDVRYVVVARNPEEAVVSFFPFLAKHSEEWNALWGMPPGALTWPDFPTFYAEMIAPGMHRGAFFDFANAWWSYRDRVNVLFLHFSEMKADHEGSIRRIADFLGIAPAPDEWARMLEYTSFDWMKRHEDKFEAITAGTIPVLTRGAMVRKGEAGAAGQDGMTPELAADLRRAGEETCEPDVLAWLYGEARQG